MPHTKVYGQPAQQHIEGQILSAVSEATDPIATRALMVAEGLPQEAAQAFMQKVIKNAAVQGMEAVSPSASRQAYDEKLEAASGLVHGATLRFGVSTCGHSGSGDGAELMEAIVGEAMPQYIQDELTLEV